MSDYIRTYLGLMGSGKTTQALADVRACPRLIIFSPVSTHGDLNKIPYLYDTPESIAHFDKFFKLHPRIRIEKRSGETPVFEMLKRIRGCAILLDDVAALKDNGSEKRSFESFIRTIRYNRNQVILTTHRAQSDVPPLVRNIGTSFYYVGPGTQDPREIESLYKLTNYQITPEEFAERLINNEKFKTFCIRRCENGKQQN